MSLKGFQAIGTAREFGEFQCRGPEESVAVRTYDQIAKTGAGISPRRTL